MSQVFGTPCCFSSRPFLKQLSSHVSADTLQLKFPGSKFFLIHSGNIWTIHLYWVQMLRFVIGLLYFFRFHFVFLFVKIYVGWEVCALASHLHVFCFQSEGGVKHLRTRGGGGVKNFRSEGSLLLGASVPHYLPCTWLELKWLLLYHSIDHYFQKFVFFIKWVGVCFQCSFTWLNTPISVWTLQFWIVWGEVYWFIRQLFSY